MSTLPPTNILVRTPEAVQLWNAPPDCTKVDTPLSSGAPSRSEVSKDGQLMALVLPEEVTVADLQQRKTVARIKSPGVVLVSFSPRNSYLVTAAKPQKQEGQQQLDNVKVWELSTGECKMAVGQRVVSKEAWPLLQWSPDEAYVFHAVTNTLHRFAAAGGFSAGVPDKLHHKGLSSFSVSPGPQPAVAVYVGESKGGPASAAIFDYSALPAAAGKPLQPLARRSFFRSQGAKMLWNSKGTALLVLAFSDHDATNQSYYGEQKLYFMAADGSMEDCLVPLKEGPVYDVQWSECGSFFVAVAGCIPAKAVLFNERCKPIYDMGSGPYNTVRWNPQGRFIAICGFGNLPGDIKFFERKGDGICKPMGEVRCPAVLSEWSPCGRMFMTAITAPRMMVDNGFKVFTYYGQLLHEEEFPTLLDAVWRPAPKGVFPDRPQSPGRREAQVTAAARPQSYVPPSMRGRQGAASSSGPRFSLSYDPKDQPGKIGQRRSPAVPGAEFVSKSSAKNAKRRAKKQAASGSDAAGGEAPAAPAAVPGPGPEAPAAADAGSEAVAVDPAKKARNLQKKLRAIELLKEKRDSGQPLEPEQIAKIGTEDALRAELEALGISA